MKAGVVVMLLAAMAAGLPAGAQDGPDEQGMVTRAIVSMGHTARLLRVVDKSERGDDVIVSVIGGSITAGAAASKRENQYGMRLTTWWRERYPKAEVEYVNAGIGATGSNIAANRAAQHLLSRKPDLVVVEFAVNDPNNQDAAETLEGLIRQILKQPQQPAVILLFTMNKAGANAQEWHSKVGLHYGLPMVSFRDGLWPEIQAGRIKYEDVQADEVHPNDRGHGYCAEFLEALVEKVSKQGGSREIPPIPAPLFSDRYEFTKILNAGNTPPLVNHGWTVGKDTSFGPVWDADQPGSALEVEFEAESVAIVLHRIKRDMGMVQTQVDDLEPEKVNAWFDADWGGYSAWHLVARDLAAGKHVLKVTLLEEKSEQSAGHHFELQAIMLGGVDGG